jgi:hypothetical protein|tara:strand:+ start:553 stop:696 length:144 start_codon:yes stop_codon:yes gene_type:complete
MSYFLKYLTLSLATLRKNLKASKTVTRPRKSGSSKAVLISLKPVLDC